MCGSFFGEQEGDFELVINSIVALKKLNKYADEDSDSDDDDLKKDTVEQPREEAPRSWWKMLFCGLF